jgi:uncharacterized protein DUF6894
VASEHLRGRRIFQYLISSYATVGLYVLLYFFHVIGRDFDDEDITGQRFSTVEGAKAYGMRIAAELMRDSDFVGARVVIVNEAGIEVANIPIA